MLLNQHVRMAGRDLHREAMQAHSAGIEWLRDPSQVPEAVVTMGEKDDAVGMCGNLAVWMASQLGSWVSNVHKDLGLAEVFEKHDLSNDDRVATRSKFQNRPEHPFMPGMTAVGEIFAVVPVLAEREGIPREQWGNIASQSREFGKSISRDGTDTQLLLRFWMSEAAQDSFFKLDPSKLKVERETGITTTTPLDDLIAEAKSVSDDSALGVGSGHCVALQARSPFDENQTFFDATWNTYGEVADRHIYPRIEDPVQPIAPPEDPWAQPEIADFMESHMVQIEMQRILDRA